jgi:alpha-mannosidase
LVLTGLKKTEDGDGLLLRFFEWWGKSGDAEIAVPEGPVSARLTNLMEEPYGNDLRIKNGKLVVPFHPFEIVSIRVYYPSLSQ